MSYQIVLSILTLICAALTIRAYYRQAVTQILVFKPLTMLFVIALAIWQSSLSNFYAQAVTVALFFSLIGDVLLIYDKFFLFGLVSFLLAHLCYIAAFWHTPFSVLAVLPFAFYILLFLGVLWNSLGQMKIPVIIYAVVIALMGWLAVSRFTIQNQTPALLSMIGALFFIASDSVLAYDRFKQQFHSARLLVLSTYFFAQLLIALSA
jgi:uncharacterized membrane protein YhhN